MKQNELRDDTWVRLRSIIETVCAATPKMPVWIPFVPLGLSIVFAGWRLMLGEWGWAAVGALLVVLFAQNLRLWKGVELPPR